MQVRPWTYFEKGVVGHVGFADPFDGALRAIIIEAVKRKEVMQGESIELHEDGTLICMGKSPPLVSSPSTPERIPLAPRVTPLQKDPNSPRAPNPTSTVPGPAPASTCPASPKPNSPAKPSSPTR